MGTDEGYLGGDKSAHRYDNDTYETVNALLKGQHLMCVLLYIYVYVFIYNSCVCLTSEQ